MVWGSSPEYKLIKDNIMVPDNTVWLPEIISLSSSTWSKFFLSNGKRLAIYPNGLISWFPTGHLTTQCELNLRLFPFDTQICDLRLETWMYTVKEMKIISSSQSAFSQVETDWFENSVWTIVGNSTITGRQKWSDGLCYSFIIYRMVLKRKPLYDIIYIILPSMLIGAAEIIVFFLPCNDTTRVEISVTCLLAYAIFQSMIIKSIPKAIDSVPLLSLFIDLQMAYIGLIAIIGDAFVFSIINSHFHSSPPSPKLMGIAISIGGRLGLRSKFLSKKVINVSIDHSEMVLDEDLIVMKQVFDQWRRFLAKKLLDKQWLFIGQVVQRLLFIIYSILYISTPVILIITSYALDDEQHLRNYDSDC